MAIKITMIMHTIIEGGDKEPWHFRCKLAGDGGEIISLPFIEYGDDYVVLDYNDGTGPSLPIRLNASQMIWSMVDRECITMKPTVGSVKEKGSMGAQMLQGWP